MQISTYLILLVLMTLDEVSAQKDIPNVDVCVPY